MTVIDAKAKSIIQRISRFGYLSRFKAVRKGICILTVITGLGTLDFISLSDDFQKNSLSPSMGNTQLVDNFIQKRCVISENSDIASVSTRTFHDQFSTAAPDLSVGFLKKLYTLIFFDSINPSPFSFFASFPLRSPPLFS